MFCPKCGAQNTEGAAFCAQCSAQINTAAYPTEAKSKKPGNGMAVGSLISGIVGFFILGFILGTVAIVLGIMARKQGSKSALAIVGIILGIIDIIGWIFILLVLPLSS